jgi:hypothetical protein
MTVLMLSCGIEIPELRYADDTVLLSQSTKGLDNLISEKKHSADQNLFLNIQKTKILTTNKSKQQPKIVIQN